LPNVEFSALRLTGRARIDLGAKGPFAGLLPASQQAPGAIVLWQGGRSLAPEA
jgi:hypothetical protein